MSDFVHLHTHSHYSLLSALPKIPDLVARAKALGMNALALTDNGNLYGTIEFYKECIDEGIKPIIGVDAYMAVRSHTDKQSGIDNKWSRIVLLAKNEDGYKNLIRIVTTGHLEGFYYKPRIDHTVLSAYREGIIAIIPSFSGDVQQALKNGNNERALELYTKYEALFGKEHTFLEITHHPEIEGHEDTMKKLITFSQKYGLSLVAAHDTYYLDPEDKPARNTLLSIQSAGDMSERRFGNEGEFHFISGETAEQFFSHIPEAISNTKKIADMCSLTLKLGAWTFPKYIVESGRSYDDELRYVVYEKGLARRNITLTDEVRQRIDYELDVIKNKGYAPYFLVVSDLLRHAHENHILTTIRGSVAGSIVTYLAGITNVNPLEYKLPFERFLNPERPSAPDIDMDYADNRRDEMIEYAKQKYGAHNVAQIGTFGTMAARGAVRDVARALGFPYATGDTISKLIPMGSQGFPMTIERALELTPELKDMYDKDDDTRSIIDMAKKIEGCARHISVHAAGVVISSTTLTDFTPLQLDTKGEHKIITQYDMHAVEDAGLLKFDFLGIKNLAILADAIERVQAIDGLQIDIENIPLDDKKTFTMLAKGETIGLFQLNGTGMTRFLKELRPSTIHDINAMVALYRPGPMESIPQYIERKHNPLLVQYLDPRMKDILSQSYGVITYQDDVMLIAIRLAGYSWLEADKLRKAMGKKIPAEMEAQKGKLHDGLIKNGMSEEKAQALWKLIEPFAAYGFNKAHAASYGRVAYQTAYMKANFPAIYMSAVLTADSGDVEKIAETIAECTRMGINVLPPDINESYSGFTVIRKPEATDGAGDNIRFGLTTIKNFGEGIADAIIKERKNGGHFTSLAQFLERVTDKNLNKKSLESLIKCGALDSFGERGCLLGNLDALLEYNKEHRGKSIDHDSLFSSDMFSHTSHGGLHLREINPAPLQERLSWEKELLGLYVSGHPLDTHTEAMKKCQMSIKQIKENLKEGMQAICYGLLDELTPFLTKGGDKMYFIKMSDYTSSIEGVIFPKIATEFETLLVKDSCIAIKGRLSMRNGVPSIIVDKMKSLSSSS